MSLTLSDSNIAEIHELIRSGMTLRIIALKFDVDIEFIRGLSRALSQKVG